MEQFLPPEIPKQLQTSPWHCWHWESARQTLIEIPGVGEIPTWSQWVLGVAPVGRGTCPPVLVLLRAAPGIVKPGGYLVQRFPPLPGRVFALLSLKL